MKVKGKKIDQIFEERTDGTLEAKIEDRIPELEGENLRLSIELDPYEDIKLDLQLQSIIPLQLSSDEKIILASSDIDYTSERPKEEPEQQPMNPIMSFRPTKKNSVQHTPEVKKEKEEWGEDNCQKAIQEGDESLKETAYLQSPE